MCSLLYAVPPAILQKPSNKNIYGNQAATFPVRFQSRLPEDTVIVWYKNEDSVVQRDLIHTVYEEEPFATTALHFANLRRRDAGRYRVAIRNNFEGLPQELRQVETTFELQVTG